MLTWGRGRGPFRKRIWRPWKWTFSLSICVRWVFELSSALRCAFILSPQNCHLWNLRASTSKNPYKLRKATPRESRFAADCTACLRIWADSFNSGAHLRRWACIGDLGVGLWMRGSFIAGWIIELAFTDRLKARDFRIHSCWIGKAYSAAWTPGKTLLKSLCLGFR